MEVVQCTKSEKYTRPNGHKGICRKDKVQCEISKPCSKNNNHEDNCDHGIKKQTNKFWIRSPVYKKQKLVEDIKVLEESSSQYDQAVNAMKLECTSMIEQKKTLGQEINSTVEENAMLKEKMDKVNKKFDKLHLLIEKKGYGKTKREKTPTSWETINDSSNCTRYSRQAGTKDLLSYIHGGVEAALYGGLGTF